MKRKMLAARIDLADKISEIASKSGTLFDYLNDVLEQAIRADELKVQLKDILDDIWVVKKAKDARFLLVPENIFHELVHQSYKGKSKKNSIKLWYETGKWYGKYYDNLEEFEGSVRRNFWDISEFSVSKKELKIICLSSKFTETHTVLFKAFLEGALDSLGYLVEEDEVAKGLLLLKMKNLEN